MNKTIEERFAWKFAANQQPGKEDPKGQTKHNREGGDFKAQQHGLPFGIGQYHS
jgi:hypothetical protein